MILKKSGRVSQPCRLFYNPNDSINNGKEIYVSNKLVIYFRIVVILTVQRYFFFFTFAAEIQKYIDYEKD